MNTNRDPRKGKVQKQGGHHNTGHATQHIDQKGHCCPINHEYAKNVMDFIDGLGYSLFITIITLITLFSDDIKIIAFEADADIPFSILTIICMVIFIAELTLLSLFKENYFLGYYFWLDILSTITMLFDLVWINELLTGGSGIEATANAAKVARAARASRIGARATKMIRIIRLIRFLKLYKTASLQMAKQAQKIHQPNQQNSKERHESIHSKGNDRTSKLVAMAEGQRRTSKRWTKLQQASEVLNNMESNHILSLNNIPYNNGSNKNLPVANPIKEQVEEDRIREDDGIRESNNEKTVVQPASNREIELHNMGGSPKSVKGTNKNIEEEEVQVDEGQIIEPLETKIGSKIKDEMQKNIISMILLILISIPIFNAGTWFDNVSAYEKGLAELNHIAQQSQVAYNAAAPIWIDNMLNLPQTLVFFQVTVNGNLSQFPRDFPSISNEKKIRDVANLRSDEIDAYTSDDGSTVIYDSSPVLIFTAQLNIGRTLFVCILLIISTILFSRDIEDYALQPLENMLETVRIIAKNPLNGIREIQERRACVRNDEEYLAQKSENTQPNILENMIIKIGSLLVVGFGEAGTQIISRVIEDSSFINVMIPGKKIMGIFGFCDIRNFTDATEILEADVMVFVNEIASICHSVVHGCGGSPNKNIGDAFLLVWKFNENDVIINQNESGQSMELAQSKKVKQTADLAVLSFVKMVAEISRSFALQKYKNNEELNKRIKNYAGVRMGFGLHVGWAIEGPIGSEYKIDATYLSPNVNMSAQLEGATKQYGIMMLITGQVYDLMTQNRCHLRQIDRVKMPGKDQPVDLYTVDVSVRNLLKMTKIKRIPQLGGDQKQLKKVQENLYRRELLSAIEVKYITSSLWEDADVKILMEPYSKIFTQKWEEGFQHYLKGNWKESCAILHDVKLMAPQHTDGPSETLLEFMEENKQKAPDSWEGYREINC